MKSGAHTLWDAYMATGPARAPLFGPFAALARDLSAAFERATRGYAAAVASLVKTLRAWEGSA